MKKSKFKKVIAVVMAAVLCLCVTGAACAKAPDSGSEIAPQNIAIAVTVNNLELGSFGKLTCYGKTTTQLGYIAEVVVELQQDNGGWETIHTFTKKGSGTIASVDEDYYVGRGTYRLKLTHKAYNSSGTLVESFNKYSKTVVY